MKNRQFLARGFSLIEVMIVVGIVGILAAIAYPSYVNQVAKGKRAECRSGVLQAMQQQERFFSQYNTYITATFSMTTPRVKVFSGDSLARSSCGLNSVACTAPGNTDVQACIEVQAIPQQTDPEAITNIFLDSDGRKGCVISGTRSTTPNIKCWP